MQRSGMLIHRHPWNVPADEARSVQRRLAPQVSRSNAIPDQPTLVAGVDASPPDARGWALGAVVLLSLPDLEVVEVCRAKGKVTFPYIPGLLSFREAPCLLEALSLLSTSPDFVLVDGHGLAHPRKFGLACHLGVLTGLPTIGCAKSILVGTHGPPQGARGAFTPLSEGDEKIGLSLRTRENTRPVYVSIGHRVDLDKAVKWTLACCAGFRLPEPLRLAHQATRS